MNRCWHSWYLNKHIDNLEALMIASGREAWRVFYRGGSSWHMICTLLDVAYTYGLVLNDHSMEPDDVRVSELTHDNAFLEKANAVFVLDIRVELFDRYVVCFITLRHNERKIRCMSNRDRWWQKRKYYKKSDIMLAGSHYSAAVDLFVVCNC